MDVLFEHSRKLMVDEFLTPEQPQGRHDHRHRSAYDLYASSARPRTGTVPLQRGAVSERGRGSDARGGRRTQRSVSPRRVEPSRTRRRDSPSPTKQPVFQPFPYS
jgi:hypothetical protein